MRATGFPDPTLIPASKAPKAQQSLRSGSGWTPSSCEVWVWPAGSSGAGRPASGGAPPSGASLPSALGLLVPAFLCRGPALLASARLCAPAPFPCHPPPRLSAPLLPVLHRLLRALRSLRPLPRPAGPAGPALTCGPSAGRGRPAMTKQRQPGPTAVETGRARRGDDGAAMARAGSCSGDAAAGRRAGGAGPEPWELSLEEVLKAYEQPINEEQAWAVCFQGCRGLRDAPGRPRLRDTADILLRRDGTVGSRREPGAAGEERRGGAGLGAGRPTSGEGAAPLPTSLPLTPSAGPGVTSSAFPLRGTRRPFPPSAVSGLGAPPPTSMLGREPSPLDPFSLCWTWASPAPSSPALCGPGSRPKAGVHPFLLEPPTNSARQGCFRGLPAGGVLSSGEKGFDLMATFGERGRGVGGVPPLPSPPPPPGASAFCFGGLQTAPCSLSTPGFVVGNPCHTGNRLFRLFLLSVRVGGGGGCADLGISAELPPISWVYQGDSRQKV